MFYAEIQQPQTGNIKILSDFIQFCNSKERTFREYLFLNQISLDAHRKWVYDNYIQEVNVLL